MITTTNITEKKYPQHPRKCFKKVNGLYQ